MERATVDIYEDRGLEWAATHATAGRRAEAESFAARVGPGRRPPGRGLRRRALPPPPGHPGHRPRRVGRHAGRLPRPGPRRPLRPGRRRAPPVRPPLDRRCLVVDDPSPRPPPPAAAGAVGSAPGARPSAPRSSCRCSKASTRATTSPGTTWAALLRRMDTATAGRPGHRGGLRRRARLAGRIRGRGAAAGGAGPHAGRHGDRRDAPPDVRGQPLAVLGRRRGRLRPPGQPVLEGGAGRRHRGPGSGSDRRPAPPRRRA